MNKPLTTKVVKGFLVKGRVFSLKQCIKCGFIKNKDNFPKKKDNKDGYSNKCKECHRQYYQEHKERLKTLARENYHKNKERYNAYDRQRSKDINRILWKQDWNENNQDKLQYYQEYRDNRKRYLTEQSKIDKCISNYLRRIILSNFDGKTTCIYQEFLNFNILQFKNYFEKLFTPEMNWSNYGSYWEIDHIVPKKTFNYSNVTDEQFKICWSLKNLRPLTAEENRKRPRGCGSDITKEQAIGILGQNLYYDIMGIENEEGA